MDSVTASARPLTGKVAVVTGGGSGIGRESARLLAAAGAEVVVAGRRAELLDTLVQEIIEAGGDALAVPTDVTRAAAVEALYGRATETFGRVDIAVLAAGVGVLKPVLDLTEDEFDVMLLTNLKGTFLTAQAAARAMTAPSGGGGTILTFPGVLGRAPMAMGAGYCAAKYGITGLTKAMALDLRRQNIRCTALHFGGVDSPFWDTITMRVQREKMLTVADAARAVLYAASQPPGAVLTDLVLQPESHQL